MGFDLDPMTVIEEKRKWLPKIAREEWIAVFVHDPYTPAAYLRERDGIYEPERVAID
jgi:hypothetical protein